MVTTQTSPPRGYWIPEQSVQQVVSTELPDLIERHSTADLLLIPVGAKFADVRKRVELLFPSVPKQ